jgi:hypothetical protein
MAQIVTIPAAPQADIAGALRALGVDLETALYTAGLLTVTLPDGVTEAEVTAALTAAEAVAPEPLSTDATATILSLRAYDDWTSAYCAALELEYIVQVLEPRYYDASGYNLASGYSVGNVLLEGDGDIRRRIFDHDLWTRLTLEASRFLAGLAPFTVVSNDHYECPGAPVLWDLFDRWIQPDIHETRAYLAWIGSGSNVQTLLDFQTSVITAAATAIKRVDKALITDVYTYKAHYKYTAENRIRAIEDGAKRPLDLDMGVMPKTPTQAATDEKYRIAQIWELAMVEHDKLWTAVLDHYYESGAYLDPDNHDYGEPAYPDRT